MKILFLPCDSCGGEVEVEPLETTQLRNVTCHNCTASLALQNSELKVKETPRQTLVQKRMVKLNDRLRLSGAFFLPPHFLSHEEQQLHVAFIRPTEQPAKSVKCS